MLDSVFITGALTHADQETRALYGQIAAMIKPFVKKVYQPGEDTLGSAQERYQQAMKRAKNSDLVLAVVNHPSTGQGFELQQALHANVPVIAVAQKGKTVSDMTRGTPLRAFIEYQNEKDLKAKLLKELEKLI